MIDGYQKYLKAINNKNPMSEAQWREAIGIVDEEEQHIPLQVRPKNQRCVKPTMQQARKECDNFFAPNYVIVERIKEKKIAL